MGGTVLYVRGPAGDGRRTLDGEFETVAATATGAAVEVLADRPIGCVVVEHASDGPGPDAVAAIRERDATVPIVFCSAEPDGELAAAATRAGATEYYAPSAVGQSLEERVRARLDEHWTAARTGDATASVDDWASVADPPPIDERYREALEAIDDGVYVLDDEGRFTFVNEALTELTGYDEAELLGERTAMIKDERTVAQAERIQESLRASEDSETTFELDILHRTGDPVPCEAHMSVVRNEDDEFVGKAGVVRDVSERRDRERRLSRLLDASRTFQTAQSTEAVAEAVVEATVDALEHDLCIVRLYDGETGQLVQVARGNSGPSLGDRPSYEVGEGGPGRAFETGETRQLQESDVEPFGDVGAFEDAIYVPLGERGAVTVATTDSEGLGPADVSLAEVVASTAVAALERVDREAELERYRTVIENVQDMVYVVDEDERFSLVTDPLADWLGYDRADLVGSHPRTVLAPGETERFESRIADLWAVGDVAASRRFETEWVTADGDHLPAEVEVSLFPTEAAYAGTVGVVRDLSELVQTRERLETQRNRFSYLFDNLPDAVVETTIDEDGRPIVGTVNDAFTEVFGYESETVVGESLDDFILPPEAQEEGRHIDERAADSEVTNREVRRRTADGFRDFLFRGVPYELDDGGTHAFGIYTDITAQKERERRLEVLNRVLRHNLRNDLNVVLGYAEMLVDELDDDLGSRAEALREKAAELAALSDRARSLDRTMRSGSPRDTTVELDGLVADAVAEYEAEFPLDVETDLASVRVVGDNRLRVAVEELLENVVEHAGPDASVRVEAESADQEVRLTVADDGPGIPENERAVITGSVDITQFRHGTGLGLWVVKWVCESCGGRLRFEESGLGGACVVLSLTPATDD